MRFTDPQEVLMIWDDFQYESLPRTDVAFYAYLSEEIGPIVYGGESRHRNPFVVTKEIIASLSQP